MLEVTITARGQTEEELQEAIRNASLQIDCGWNKGIGTAEDLQGSYEYHIKGYDDSACMVRIY